MYMHLEYEPDVKNRKKKFCYATILYRCHGVNIDAKEFSLLQTGHTAPVLTQPHMSTYWRKGTFPEENEAWPCSCQALPSSMEIITHGAMHPLIHKHS
jgi:hypothetical protein